MNKLRQSSELTKDQRRTLSELKNLTDEQGYPLTVAELRERLKLRKAVVHHCLNSLIDRGFVRKTPGKARSQRTEVMHIVAAFVELCVEADEKSV